LEKLHDIFNVENNETLTFKKGGDVSFHNESKILRITNLCIDFFEIDINNEGSIFFGNYNDTKGCFSTMQAFPKKISIEDIRTIIFEKCNFKKFVCYYNFGIKMFDVNIDKFEYFANEEVKNDFYLSGNIDFININNTIFSNKVGIYPENNLNSEIIINDCHFEKELKIKGQEKDSYKERQEKKTEINKLQIIDFTAGNEAYLRMGFIEAKEFILSNFKNPQNTELNIGDCKFENFRLSNFRNLGKFKLFKINILNKEKKDNKEFQIDNTSIGSADFQSIDLSSFKKLIIFDNIFTNLDYTNILWGSSGNGLDIEIIEFEDDKNKIDKQQDTYRTLKNVASRNNDQPQALKFFAKEMEKYTQSVENNKKIYSLSDRTTLWFNKNTNNFGLDFWKPIGILLYLSMMFYSLFKISITNSNQDIFLYILFFSLIVYGVLLVVKEKEIKYITIPHWIFLLIPIFITSFGVFEYDDFIKEFFIFLNPLHKMIDFNSYKSLSAFSYAIDFLFRIVEGLLIYQIIQAFRKYGRRF
jgi:hypothetical protein